MLSTDDLSTDDLSTDDLFTDDLSTDDLSTDDLSTDDLSVRIFKVIPKRRHLVYTVPVCVLMQQSNRASLYEYGCIEAREREARAFVLLGCYA